MVPSPAPNVSRSPSDASMSEYPLPAPITSTAIDNKTPGRFRADLSSINGGQSTAPTLGTNDIRINLFNNNDDNTIPFLGDSSQGLENGNVGELRNGREGTQNDRAGQGDLDRAGEEEDTLENLQEDIDAMHDAARAQDEIHDLRRLAIAMEGNDSNVVKKALKVMEKTFLKNEKERNQRQRRDIAELRDEMKKRDEKHREEMRKRDEKHQTEIHGLREELRRTREHYEFKLNRVTEDANAREKRIKGEHLIMMGELESKLNKKWSEKMEKMRLEMSSQYAKLALEFSTFKNYVADFHQQIITVVKGCQTCHEEVVGFMTEFAPEKRPTAFVTKCSELKTAIGDLISRGA